jgi:hypothetical protein
MTPEEIAQAALALQGAIEAGFLVGVKLFGVVFGVRVLLGVISRAGGND